MADLPEPDEFPEGIYQLEQDDPVLGGAPNEATGAGMDNIPHHQLAKRTRWLRTRVDALLEQVVAATAAVAGIVRLSSAINSTDTTTAATPSAVKAAYDNAESRVAKTTTISAGGLATGGGALSANRTITVPAATQAEAEAGTANDKAMTPLRVSQAVAALIGGIASAAGFSVSMLANGYIVFPSWLGGLVLQWGAGATTSAGTVTTVTFPIAFPTAPRRVIAVANAADHLAANHAVIGVASANWTATSFGATAIKHDGAFVTTNFHFIAVGH